MLGKSKKNKKRQQGKYILLRATLPKTLALAELPDGAEVEQQYSE